MRGRAHHPRWDSPYSSSSFRQWPIFVSCSETRVEDKHVYFYAQAEAPEGAFQAFRCSETDSPTAPPLCDATLEYVIEEGVLRISCGEWDGEAGALGPVADFVRIERTSVE
jgi:hypothetical protein